MSPPANENPIQNNLATIPELGFSLFKGGKFPKEATGIIFIKFCIEISKRLSTTF